MIRGSLLALLGLASFVAVYVAMDPREPTRPTVSEPATESAAADVDPAEIAPAHTTSIKDSSQLVGPDAITFQLRPGAHKSQEFGPDETAVAVRDVTPPDMTAGPKVTGRLTRVERPEPEPEARVERLYKPIVVAAGTLKVRGRDIRLAGIAAPDFDERCGEGAAAWPCGRMARAALRRFIRGRAIECDVPEGAEEIPDRAICRVAGNDIAKWLVARGWAKRSGDLYDEEEDAAREAKLGLWGDARPGNQAGASASG